MNKNEGCGGGTLYLGGITVYEKKENGRVPIRFTHGVDNIEININKEGGKRIVDNLSSQLGLEYAGVDDVYKMIKNKLEDDLEIEALFVLKEIVLEISERYPQVIKGKD